MEAIAYVLAIGFGFVWVLVRGWRQPETGLRLLPLTTAAAWLGLALYERNVVQDGDNIRADLVIFLPLFIGLSVAAGAALLATAKPRQEPEH